jgi:DNA-binding transcriptional LysR family regulator
MNEHFRGTLAFVTAARQGSFTRAARLLDLSPQAVAASIARLETALDVRLFNRTTRSIALTEEGSAFLARAEIGLAALDDAAQSVRDKKKAPSGLVRVTCGAAFGRIYLMPILAGFYKKYPGVRLDLSFDDHKVDIVRDGFDVAFRGGTIVDSSLITRRICALNLAMVASPAYLKKYGVPRSPDDLDAHRIIMLRFASGASVSWNLRVKGKAATFDAQSPSLIMSDTAAVGDAAVAGLGISRVSLHFAWSHLQAGRLKIVLNEFNDPGARELVIHYPHREHVAPRIRAFVEYALETLQNDPNLNPPKHPPAEFCV